MINLLA